MPHTSPAQPLPLSPPLRAVVDALKGAERLDVETLAGALAQAPVTVDDVSPWVGWSTDRYVRSLIYRDPRFEVRLLCWRPGQSSALHGHGVSACAFRVVQGDAVEVRVSGATQRLVPGDIGTAVSTDTHQLGAAPSSQTGLLSLHVYAPPLPVDEPTTSEGGRVVILGGGFTGVATAIQLLRTGRPDLRITIVERGDTLGLGVAFDSPDDNHTLNVPLSAMTVDPATPRAFYEFVRARRPEARPWELVSRNLFGQFVHAALAEEVRRAPGRVRVLRDTAIDVVGGDTPEVVLASGARLSASAVVLATGHLSTAPRGAVEGDPRVITNPWVKGTLRSIPTTDRVLLVGTALTAVDVLRTLRSNGHQGEVVAVSRRGLWPARHLEEVLWTGSLAYVDPEQAPRTAHGLVDWVRAEVARHQQSGVPWQAVIDAVRTHTTQLWTRLPHAERLIFWTEVRPLWEMVRHRAHRDHIAELKAWEAEGGLRRESAELRHVRAEGYTRVATLRRADGEELQLTVDRVIHCAGQLSDITKTEDVLWRSLLARELVAPDEARTGLRTDDHGHALDTHDRPTGLFAVGSWCRPNRWESTAAPDLAIRVAAMVPAVIATLPATKAVNVD